MKTELGDVTFVDRENGRVVKMTGEEFLAALGVTHEMAAHIRANTTWIDEEILLNDMPEKPQ